MSGAREQDNKQHTSLGLTGERHEYREKMEEAAGSLYSANSGDWRHLIRETGRVSAQSVRRIVNKANPSAREWFLSIICMFELGALKPTKRYLHSLYSHLQRQFRNEKRVCWERRVPAVRCQQKKKVLGCFFWGPPRS